MLTTCWNQAPRIQSRRQGPSPHYCYWSSPILGWRQSSSSSLCCQLQQVVCCCSSSSSSCSSLYSQLQPGVCCCAEEWCSGFALHLLPQAVCVAHQQNLAKENDSHDSQKHYLVVHIQGESKPIVVSRKAKSSLSLETFQWSSSEVEYKSLSEISFIKWQIWVKTKKKTKKARICNKSAYLHD